MYHPPYRKKKKDGNHFVKYLNIEEHPKIRKNLKSSEPKEHLNSETT